MTATVLWRRLSATDFKAMNGKASPLGHGGGAMHIALGVRTDKFPIDNFLGAHGKTEATITASADRESTQLYELAFSGNPVRRGGEWRIRDQYSHRHPGWTPTFGFPSTYDAKNPIYILLFKTVEKFHARYSLESDLQKLSPSSRPKGMMTIPSGIALASPELTTAFLVKGMTRLDEFLIQQDEETGEQFDPNSVSDGRKRILSSVIRRLGQRTFRRKLISAYSSQCAITHCRTIWVLEAAHISPYKGIKTNSVTNGLLLRADVHTLFDLALITIQPSKFVVQVSQILEGSPYEDLDGKQPILPSKSSLQPSIAALEYHYRLFQA